jgi:hypothetical protein
MLRGPYETLHEEQMEGSLSFSGHTGKAVANDYHKLER